MKTCKTCNIPKDPSEFYAHPRMSDGRLGHCKECKKKYQRDRSRSPAGRAYDRKRLSTPKRKKWLIEYQRLKRARWPEKSRAWRELSRAIKSGLVVPSVCAVCGEHEVHGHHPDYSKPLEVIWLCPAHHREVHKQYKRTQP